MMFYPAPPPIPKEIFDYLALYREYMERALSIPPILNSTSSSVTAQAIVTHYCVPELDESLIG